MQIMSLVVTVFGAGALFHTPPVAANSVEFRFNDDAPLPLFTERGHKKKKVHKEIKKLVIKVIVAIFLVMQKIKWALLMIQTILLNNFILVATLFVLTKTFKVWHEIKHYKHQGPEKQIIVYDNVHHQHVDDLAHSEYEDGHGHSHGWNWWGARSFQTQTEATTNEQEYENDYYSGRVVRSTRDRPRRRRRRNTS